MGGRPTEPWRQYQTDVADLLGESGFETAVEDEITSSRGVTHEVDVSAHRTVAGVDVLWIVECKSWRSRVGKEKVATLAAICDDLGADRGVLISESGFQSGAVKMAAGRSITLTSLEDVRSNAAADLLEARQQQAERRLRELVTILTPELDGPNANEEEQILQFLAANLPESRLQSFVAAPESTVCANQEDLVRLIYELIGLDHRRVGYIMGQLAAELVSFNTPGFSPLPAGSGDLVLTRVAELREWLATARLGHWPVILRDRTGDYRVAWTLEQLLGVAEPVLTYCEEHEYTILKAHDVSTRSSLRPLLRDDQTIPHGPP